MNTRMWRCIDSEVTWRELPELSICTARAESATRAHRRMRTYKGSINMHTLTRIYKPDQVLLYVRTYIYSIYSSTYVYIFVYIHPIFPTRSHTYALGRRRKRVPTIVRAHARGASAVPPHTTAAPHRRPVERIRDGRAPPGRKRRIPHTTW